MIGRGARANVPCSNIERRTGEGRRASRETKREERGREARSSSDSIDIFD